MGLAVQAPADPLLAIFAEPAAGEGAPGAPPLAEGMFATLLAGILDGQLHTGAEEAAVGPAPLVATEEPGDQTPDDPALALLASIAALQAVPQPLPAAPHATSGDADGAPETVVAVTAGPGATQPGPGEAVALAVAPEEAASTAAEPPALPTEQDPLRPAGWPVPAEASVEVETPATADGPIPPAMPAEASAATLEQPADRPGPPPDQPSGSYISGTAEAAGPPAGDTAPATEGVVRSVGNANESAPGQGDSHSGRKPEDARPLPRASANGIAHASANSAVGELRQAAPEAPTPEVADAPAPADPPAELPQQVDQVASAVIERVEAGGGEARIHLEPLELGEVTIHVRTDGDEVRIEIRAERPDAARLLRDHTQDLSSLLGSRGLNLSDVNVGVGGGNAGSLFESRRDQPRPVAGEFAAVLGLDDDPSSASRHNRLRAAYNPDGALLYRV